MSKHEIGHGLISSAVLQCGSLVSHLYRVTLMSMGDDGDGDGDGEFTNQVFFKYFILTTMQ